MRRTRTKNNISYKKMKSNGEEMREIGLLTVVHDEHEGLLTVGPSECAREGCQAGACGP